MAAALESINATLHQTMEKHAADSVPTLSLGPRMHEFVSSCMEASPARFIFFWTTATVAMVITLFTWWQHSSEIAKRPPSVMRLYYNRVTWFAPVLAISAWTTLFSPRVFLMMKMFNEQAEAIALQAFGNVLFCLCAEASYEKYLYTDKKGNPVALKMLEALNEEGPAPHFAVPPFGCCFVKCMPPFLLKPFHLSLAANFIRQYAFVVVAGSLMSLWCALANDLETSKKFNGYISIITKLSAFTCIYGLFIMYKATHHLLEKWHPTAKFVSLKIVVILMAYQELMIKKLVAWYPAISGKCLADSEHPSEEVQKVHREHFISMYLIVIESILVATLVKNAFKASELGNQSMEANTMLLEMDLAKLEDPLSESGSDSGSESG